MYIYLILLILKAFFPILFCLYLFVVSASFLFEFASNIGLSNLPYLNTKMRRNDLCHTTIRHVMTVVISFHINSTLLFVCSVYNFEYLAYNI